MNENKENKEEEDYKMSNEAEALLDCLGEADVILEIVFAPTDYEKDKNDLLMEHLGLSLFREKMSIRRSEMVRSAIDNLSCMVYLLKDEMRKHD